MNKKALLGIGEEGNTATSSPIKQQGVRRKYYCGTMFNYDTIGTIGIENRLKEISEKYILGKEICPSTGKKHLQMFIILKKPMRITEIKCPGNPHLEACKGDEESNLKYCSKEGDFIKYGYPKPIEIIENLYPWQKKIENICLGTVDKRKIYWFYEETGNIGKSAFVKYMVIKHGCIFCQGGKESDLMNLIFNSDMDRNNIVLFDLPRAHKGHISYSSLENIKNGLVCNTKYETGFKAFNPPHVIIFANYPPEKPELLSRDRWCIWSLKIDCDVTDEVLGTGGDECEI